MDLTQNNNIFSDLHKILDLVFIIYIVHSNVTLAEHTINNWVVHHKPFCLITEVYSFLSFIDSNPKYIFDPLNWCALLSNSCIETCIENLSFND